MASQSYLQVNFDPQIPSHDLQPTLTTRRFCLPTWLNAEALLVVAALLALDVVVVLAPGPGGIGGAGDHRGRPVAQLALKF